METKDSLEYKIIETAKRLFVEKGFHKTSMSDIAAATGINRTTLHYYFRTKEKMFQAVFGSLVESFMPKIEIIFTEDIPLTEKFSKVLDEYFSIFISNPGLPRFILSEIDRDVNHLLDAGRAMHMDKYLSSIEQVLLKEMATGNIRTLPMPTVLLSFMSQVTFPFLAKNIVMTLFHKDEKGYAEFLAEWKINIIRQMEILLLK